MARPQNSRLNEAIEASASAAEAETTEVTETPDAETPAESTEAPATETPAKGDVEIDLHAFTEALDASVAGASDSGDPTDESITELQKQYQALEGSAPKAAARKLVVDRMKAAVDASQLEQAKAYFFIEKNVKTAPKAAKKAKANAATKTPADPNVAYLDKRTTLHLAFSLLPKPEGLAEDIETRAGAAVSEIHPQAVAYLTWLQASGDNKGDEPEVSPVAKAAAKLALGKAVKGGGAARTSDGPAYDGPARSVKAHIISAFDGVASGTFLKVSEIVNHRSTEYGTDSPSPGAVTGALKSAKSPIDGLIVDADAKPFGATKA